MPSERLSQFVFKLWDVSTVAGDVVGIWGHQRGLSAFAGHDCCHVVAGDPALSVPPWLVAMDIRVGLVGLQR